MQNGNPDESLKLKHKEAYDLGVSLSKVYINPFLMVYLLQTVKMKYFPPGKVITLDKILNSYLFTLKAT